MLLKSIKVISNERLLNITFKITPNNSNLHTKKLFFYLILTIYIIKPHTYRIPSLLPIHEPFSTIALFLHLSHLVIT